MTDDRSSNQLSELGPGISQLKNLRVLLIQHNRLTRCAAVLSKPQNLCSCTWLNRASGRLPASMAEMKSLERVALVGNNIKAADSVVEQLVETCVSRR